MCCFFYKTEFIILNHNKEFRSEMCIVVIVSGCFINYYVVSANV